MNFVVFCEFLLKILGNDIIIIIYFHFYSIFHINLFSICFTYLFMMMLLSRILLIRQSLFHFLFQLT
jgi:hypothetical protein